MWRSSPLHCHGLLDIPTVGSSRAEERERERAGGRRRLVIICTHVVI